MDKALIMFTTTTTTTFDGDLIGELIGYIEQLSTDVSDIIGGLDNNTTFYHFGKEHMQVVVTTNKEVSDDKLEFIEIAAVGFYTAVSDLCPDNFKHYMSLDTKPKGAHYEI